MLMRQQELTMRQEELTIVDANVDASRGIDD